jgi:hypothetical protein
MGLDGAIELAQLKDRGRKQLCLWILNGVGVSEENALVKSGESSQP